MFVALQQNEPSSQLIATGQGRQSASGSDPERAKVARMTDRNESELTRLAADVDIRNLLARVAHLADGGEVGDYLALFTEDATWEMDENPRAGVAASRLEGIDAIGAGVRERRKAATPGVIGMHFVTTTAIDIEADGDAATAHSYYQFVSGAKELTLRVAGNYHDTLRRTEGGWKVASRMISFA